MYIYIYIYTYCIHTCQNPEGVQAHVEFATFASVACFLDSRFKIPGKVLRFWMSVRAWIQEHFPRTVNLIIGSIRNRREMSWSRKIGMVQSQCFSRKITWLINRHFLICAYPLLLQFSVSFSFSFSFSIHSNFYQNQIGRSCSQNVFAYTSRFVTSRFVQLSTKQMTWECKMHSKMQRALFFHAS